MEYFTPLLVASLLGALLGLERSIAGKHAGMRTYALVSLGSCLFVIVGTVASYQLVHFTGVNPLTVASNVVVAIGFLGAGLTVFRGEHPVELTTAAGLWLTAGVGMAAGFGMYSVGLTATVMGLIIFSLLARIEHYVSQRFKVGHEG